MATTPQDFTVGQVLTAVEMDMLPQGIIAMATPITSNVGPTSSTTELDVITAPAVTPAQAGRRWRLRFHCKGIATTVADVQFFLRIKEGGTTLGESNYKDLMSSNTAVATGGDFEAIVDSPSVAAHTYKVTIQRQVGTGNATIAGSSTGPILFYVEDVGAA